MGRCLSSQDAHILTFSGNSFVQVFHVYFLARVDGSDKILREAIGGTRVSSHSTVFWRPITLGSIIRQSTPVGPIRLCGGVEFDTPIVKTRKSEGTPHADLPTFDMCIFSKPLLSNTTILCDLTQLKYKLRAFETQENQVSISPKN